MFSVESPVNLNGVTEKTQYPGFMFPQVVQRQNQLMCGEVIVCNIDVIF